MRTLLKPLSIVLAAAVFTVAFPLFAQEESNAPVPAGVINVEQASDVGAVGVWTMIQPNQQSFQRTDANLSMPGMMPGQYTFISTLPKGTLAHIDVLLGDDIIITSETQQITFTLADKMTLTLRVKYTLSVFGKVGVNSVPTGVPFTLTGPDGLTREGVTPQEYPKFPIGNYSVTYRPDGCPEPSAKSGLLTKDSRANFMIEIVCDTFRPAKEAAKPTNISFTVDGKLLSFHDVPVDAWFAPYIATVVSRGIMAGYSDDRGAPAGRFGPGDPVTIAQLAKIAHTVIKLDENLTTSDPKNLSARGGWFTRYIASAEEQGWLIFEDKNLDPNRQATRGEVVSTLLQLFDEPLHWSKGAVFTDVKKNTPYASEIESAAAAGIVSGEADAGGNPTGLFHPLDPITRAEIAKMLITVHEKYQPDKE